MRIRILGAGLIGLVVADELLRRGHLVDVVDPAPGSGASLAAAGMLAPSAEVWHGETALLQLGLRSLALWPTLAARLSVPLRGGGTLLVGVDHGDRQQVRRQADLLTSLGRTPTVLTGPKLRRTEPGLTTAVGDGLLLPQELSVDPRAVLAALRAEVPVRPRPTTDRVDATVIATGARLPAPWTDLVRGVRGEIVRVRHPDPPRHTVRGWVHGEPVYLVPRDDGEIVVGATSEEHDGPPVVTVAGVARLLAAARTLWPGLDRAELVETLARDRPCTADNLPLIGPAPGRSPVELPGPVLLAAGHHRHGVLLAPLTAHLIADHLEHGMVEDVVDPRRLDPGEERER